MVVDNWYRVKGMSFKTKGLRAVKEKLPKRGERKKERGKRIWNECEKKPSKRNCRLWDKGWIIWKKGK